MNTPSSSRVTDVKAFTSRILLDSRFRGDGEPSWLTREGTANEREAESYHDADVRRRRLVKSLKRFEDNGTSGLADRLAECCWDHPCGSGACPVCMRTAQRHFVHAGEHLLKAYDKSSISLASIVPVDCRFTSLARARVEWRRHCRQFAEALAESGASVVLAGADFSINETSSSFEASYVQGHFYAFLVGADTTGRAGVRRAFPRSELVPRPVVFKRWDGSRTALAYAMKSSFSLRTSVVAERADRAPHQNTHVRALFGRRLVRLSLLLDRIGLDSRRILIGAKRSRRGCNVRYRLVLDETG